MSYALPQSEQSWRRTERPPSLLAAEYLGPLASEFIVTGDLSERVCGAAWHYAELAIAESDPSLMEVSGGFLDRLPSTYPGDNIRTSGDLLRIYATLFLRRAEQRTPTHTDWMDVRGQVVGRIIDLTNGRGFPISKKQLDNSKRREAEDERGRLCELVTLLLLDNSYPGSPREEDAPHSLAVYNHDCYQWESGVKVPVQVKFRPHGEHYDRRIFQLPLGEYLFGRLVRNNPRYESLTSMYPELEAGGRSVPRLAALALMVDIIVKQSYGDASPLEEEFYASTKEDLSQRVQDFGKRRHLERLR
jgi:hypothetical protein